MKARAAASVLLSLAFVAVYGACNWITAQRTGVGTLHFEWERHIPFVAWMIVPYLSIDLFFVAAPFLCRDSIELRTYARRTVLAIAVAGSCFLLVPFRFAFERPHAPGLLGACFDAFRQLDAPYNLFPSLHITLLAILADLYGRHTRGVVRVAAQAWFSLIGLSTVLTYQHHVLDVAGGFALAAICFYAVREPAARAQPSRNVRVGSYYAAAAGTLLVAAALWRSWAFVLAWPGLSLAIVSAAYFGIGPRVFRKRGGRLPLSTRVVLGPVLAGHWLSRRYYQRRCSAWDEVLPGLLAGASVGRREAEEAVRQGVTAVLDLTCESGEAPPFLAVTYRNVPVLDLTAPTPDQLCEAIDFIAEQSRTGVVYVHCKLGYSRTAAVVGAYLLASGRAATAGEAVALLRQARPSVIVRPEALDAVRMFLPSSDIHRFAID